MAKATAVAAAFAEMQRFQLHELAAQVYAFPVLGVLEKGLVHLLEHADWQWAESLTPAYHNCVRRWIGSVRERIGRKFLPSGTDALKSVSTAANHR